jgi:large subunit ribosomal protein L18
MSVKTKESIRLRRRRRVRAKVRGSAERPRLSVFRWTEPDFKGLQLMEQATKAGAALAQRAKDKGVNTIVFDRGGYLYHGRVKALADGAREAGLKF